MKIGNNYFYIQQKYSDRNIETRIKGDKLVFTQSNSVYRDKLGSRPTADEVINGDEVKTVISTGKSVKDNGNRFIGHATYLCASTIALNSTKNKK